MSVEKKIIFSTNCLVISVILFVAISLFFISVLVIYENDDNNNNNVGCKLITIYIPFYKLRKQLQNYKDDINHNNHWKNFTFNKKIIGTAVPVKRCLYFQTQSCLADEFCTNISNATSIYHGNMTIDYKEYKLFEILIVEDNKCVCSNDKHLKFMRKYALRAPKILSFKIT